MAAIYSNGGNRWNILGFNFTKRDALSSVYKISMVSTSIANIICIAQITFKFVNNALMIHKGRLQFLYFNIIANLSACENRS